ncbi:MAG: hypothetical protein Sw1PiTSA_07780 [Shewanella algae]
MPYCADITIRIPNITLDNKFIIAGMSFLSIPVKKPLNTDDIRPITNDTATTKKVTLSSDASIPSTLLNKE